MKGSVAVVLALIVAGVTLYYESDRIVKNAAGNPEFLALYNGAQAARRHRGLYPSEAGAQPPAETPKAPASGESRPNTPVSLEEGKAGSTDSAVGTTAAEASFGYPPYFALMMYPLSFTKSLEAAALAWYWANVVFFVAAMFLAMYALSGMFGTGEKALFLVPLVVSIPLAAWYLPAQSPVILALVLVLGGLCLYRAGLDIPAGIMSSLAFFSPLGPVFLIYYIAKRAWLAVLGGFIGVIVWFAVLPAVYFGPQTALDETQNYIGAVLVPLPARAVSPDTLSAPDNCSVWAMLRRNSAGIDSLMARASDFAKSRNAGVPQYNWTMILSVSLGVIMLIGTVLGIWRRLNDRELAIVGLEGGVLVTALLLLAPYTPRSALVALIFPLFGAVYAIRQTDIRKLVHHVNYVGVILAAECFCLAFLSETARLYGAAFAGTFILWIAVLAAVAQFRPHLIRGARSILAEGPRPRDDKPIELVSVKARGDEKEEQREKETKEGKKKKGGIIPMPSFVWKKEKFEGAAGVETEPERPEVPPLELAPEDVSKEKEKPEGAPDVEPGPKPAAEPPIDLAPDDKPKEGGDKPGTIRLE